MKRIAPPLLLAVLLSALLAGSAHAKVELSYVPAKPIKLTGAATPDREYDADGYVWLRCRGRATALMAGWSGARAPIAIIYSHLLEQHRYLGLAVRKPLRNGTIRGRTLCATGLRVKIKDSPDGAGKVACARSQLAIGVPIDGGPYVDRPVYSRPNGARGWVSDEGGRTKAICVPARSFRAVKRVRRAASFKVGRSATTVAARCPGKRRPISWGFEAGTLEDNAWRSVESSTTITSPFIAASQPKGAAGWALTFATPDGAGARGATRLALHLTCAIPR